MSMLALLLPYWSKVTFDIESQGQLELTFGLWGSCFNMRPQNRTTVDSPVVMNGSEVIAIEPESVASDLLTCGSYFNQETIRISCTSFRQLASGQCRRREYEAQGTLCDQSVAVAFIGQDVQAPTIARWLIFLESACGRTGRVTVVSALLSSMLTGLSIVLLLVGITCARVDSCLIRYGVVCSGLTAISQTIIAILWATESHAMAADHPAFGTSFYLNIVTSCLHISACVAARKHQSLETEAHAETLADWVAEKNQDGSHEHKPGVVAV